MTKSLISSKISVLKLSAGSANTNADTHTWYIFIVAGGMCTYMKQKRIMQIKRSSSQSYNVCAPRFYIYKYMHIPVCEYLFLFPVFGHFRMHTSNKNEIKTYCNYDGHIHDNWHVPCAQLDERKTQATTTTTAAMAATTSTW